MIRGLIVIAVLGFVVVQARPWEGGLVGDSVAASDPASMYRARNLARPFAELGRRFGADGEVLELILEPGCLDAVIKTRDGDVEAYRWQAGADGFERSFRSCGERDGWLARLGRRRTSGYSPAFEASTNVPIAVGLLDDRAPERIVAALGEEGISRSWNDVTTLRLQNDVPGKAPEHLWDIWVAGDQPAFRHAPVDGSSLHTPGEAPDLPDIPVTPDPPVIPDPGVDAPVLSPSTSHALRCLERHSQDSEKLLRCLSR